MESDCCHASRCRFKNGQFEVEQDLRLFDQILAVTISQLQHAAPAVRHWRLPPAHCQPMRILPNINLNWKAIDFRTIARWYQSLPDDFLVISPTTSPRYSGTSSHRVATTHRRQTRRSARAGTLQNPASAALPCFADDAGSSLHSSSDWRKRDFSFDHATGTSLLRPL